MRRTPHYMVLIISVAVIDYLADYHQDEQAKEAGQDKYCGGLHSLHELPALQPLLLLHLYFLLPRQVFVRLGAVTLPLVLAAYFAVIDVHKTHVHLAQVLVVLLAFGREHCAT